MFKPTIYRECDRKRLEECGILAQLIWDRLADKYMKDNPRPGIECWGSCVIGEGFYVYFIPKGKRKPIKMFLCTASGAAFCGSIPWENSKDEVAEYIKSNGIEAYFTYGRMD